jgi:L-alanine-DL-glutamate epimerase-like enolase superfamily enzyme
MMATTSVRQTSQRAETPIRQLAVSAYQIPTATPQEADGTITWDHTTLVLVEASAGDQTGIGWTYASTATARLIQDVLAPRLNGRNAMDISACWLSMNKALRNIGRPGIGTMAIAAVDNALWDLKAKLLDLPLVSLLGAARSSIPVYGSGGFTDYSMPQLQEQLSGWVDQGLTMVKLKVGSNPDKDPERVKAARDAIGSQTALFVDANGAYDLKQALALSEKFYERGVSWFEEPVSSDNLEGLQFLRASVPPGMNIAAGEYGYDLFYFRRMMNAVDILQVDATRCGGVTGFLGASNLCEAACVPLSAHTAPSIHAHLTCAVRPAIHLEYFYDHVRIENMLFDGVLQPIGGELKPDLARTGIGLAFKGKDAEKYRKAF